jgi:hypothetical protein
LFQYNQVIPLKKRYAIPGQDIQRINKPGEFPRVAFFSIFFSFIEIDYILGSIEPTDV